MGGWRWLSLRVEVGGYGVTGRGEAGVFLFRPAALLGFALLRGRISLRLEAGLFGEVLSVTNTDGNSLQGRFGLKVDLRLEWKFASRWSLLLSPAGLFSATEFPFLQRGQLFYQADFWQIELMVGICFDFW